MVSSGKIFVPGVRIDPTVSNSDHELDNSASDFVLHCSSGTLHKIEAHSRRFRHTEVFGLLLGRVYRTPSQKLRTVIEDYLPAQRFTKSSITFVEVSPEELIRMDRIFEESSEKAGLLKVGWFHTHPGHGIFMSTTDKENHLLYQKKWQVALVVDPVAEKHGFFWGQDCEPLRDIIYVSDETPPSTEGGSLEQAREQEHHTNPAPRFGTLSRVWQSAVSSFACAQTTFAYTVVHSLAKSASSASTPATLLRLRRIRDNGSLIVADIDRATQSR